MPGDHMIARGLESRETKAREMADPEILADAPEPAEITEEEIRADAEAQKNLGNEKYKAGAYLEAVKFYGEAIKLLPNEATYYGNRSAAYLMLKSYDGALEDCTKATTLDPGYTKCHSMLGDFTAAKGQLLEVLKRDPRHEEALAERTNITKLEEDLEKAQEQAKAKKWDAVLFIADRILSRAPEANQVKLLKAEALLGTGKHDQVVALCGILLQYDRQNSHLLFMRGRAMMLNGELDKAVKHFQEAMRVDPDFTSCRLMYKKVRSMNESKQRGNELFSSGKIQDAIDAYSECLALDPENKSYNGVIFCNRAAALLKFNKFKEALVDCDECLIRIPDYSKAVQRRALCLKGLEEWEEAVRAWEHACRLDSDNRELKQKLREAKLDLKKSKRKDYYKILGVSKDATDTEIKKGYRKMALQWHPDKQSTEDSEGQAKAEKMFKDIGEAYGVLSDQSKRQRYDQGADLEEIEGGGGGAGFGGMDEQSIFQMFFGGGGGGMGGMDGMGGMGGFSFGGGHGHGGMGGGRRGRR